MTKRASLLLIVTFTVSSLILIESVFAQSIPKPSVPEFTLKYVDYSYDVPPTYGIDQYTGENVTIKAGYHVDGRMLEFTVKNQPFAPYNDSSGNEIGLYYNFRYKGLYGDEWSYYPFEPDGYSTLAYGRFTVGSLSPKYPASSSDYTVVSVNVSILGIHGGVQAEFQAQALVGHIDYQSSGLLAGSYYNFIGERSGWSNTQTITIGTSSSTPPPAVSPSPTPTPDQSNTQADPQGELYGIIAVLVVIIAALLIGIVALMRRKSVIKKKSAQ